MDRLASRFQGLRVERVRGLEVPVATSAQSRLLGLACLDRAAAGRGLLIPRCSSVHTFGMRFHLDLYFLGPHGTVVGARHAVPPRRVAFCAGAAAVLELPAEQGGELSGHAS